MYIIAAAACQCKISVKTDSSKIITILENHENATGSWLFPHKTLS